MQREKYSDTRQNGCFKNHIEEDISSSSELSDAFGHSAHFFEEKKKSKYNLIHTYGKSSFVCY